MSHDPPPPLKSERDAAHELERALRALRDERPDAARLARVAEKLGPLLDAPPPPVPLLARFLRLVGSKGLALRLPIAVLAVGATVVWLGGSPAPSGDAHPARKPAPSVTPSAATDAVEAAPAQPAPVEGLGAAVDQQLVVHERLRSEPVAQSATAPRPQRAVRARREHTGGKLALQATGTAISPATSNADSNADTASEAATADVTPPPPEPPLEVAPPPAEPPPEAPPAAKLSEEDLLFEARQEARRDPGAALRLLDQHAAHFASGMLAPEREVLAIEVLRRLGQHAAAEQRLRAFRERHPDSLHLRRLENRAR